MPNLLSPAFVRFLRRSWEGYAYCRSTYRKFRPSVVLGMGGFTSTAPILAARRLKLPTFDPRIQRDSRTRQQIHGALRHARAARLSGLCPLSFQNLDCVVTGTPVRRNLGSPLEPREQHSPHSASKKTGALFWSWEEARELQASTRCSLNAAPLLKDKPLQIIHLTGDRDDRLAAANYQRENIPHYVAPFHHRMEEAYSAADLVISRAGAASLSELSHFGLASILIPYPYATDDHQTSNAKVFAEAGAAEVQTRALLDSGNILRR